MNRLHCLARAPHVRRPGPSAVILLALLAQMAACQPETDPGTAPESGDSSPGQSTNNPSVKTSPYSLTASVEDTDIGTHPPPGSGAFTGVLTTQSNLGTLDFRYDAYIVTARKSDVVVIQSDVIEARAGGYPYGYGYPISMTHIEEGISFTASGGSFYQNALDTGTAIMDYPVLAGHQYILVYKTFGAFTPLKYRLILPSSLIIEGRIHMPPRPVPIPENSSGLITLDNPRPDVLSQIVPWLNEHVTSN